MAKIPPLAASLWNFIRTWLEELWADFLAELPVNTPSCGAVCWGPSLKSYTRNTRKERYYMFLILGNNRAPMLHTQELLHAAPFLPSLFYIYIINTLSAGPWAADLDPQSPPHPIITSIISPGSSQLQMWTSPLTSELEELRPVFQRSFTPCCAADILEVSYQLSSTSSRMWPHAL